ncbi:diguanylate cyclase domain-containing protein [Vibrio owensii]|uniref:diguanylate cyclase domain-containing protein n=1 Tax=Vibrio owensii TaxID=696485 RepID=UPI003AAFD220
MKFYSVVFVFYLAFLFFDYKNSVLERLEDVNEFSRAVRQFTTDNIQRSKVEDLFPLNVPAHNVNTVMSLLSGSEASYQEISVNPTNLKNKANAKDSAIIDSFAVNNQSVINRFDVSDLKFKQYRPIYVNDHSCLSCHSTYEAASLSQQQRYPSRTGYGYQLGDIYGAKVSAIDMSWFITKHTIVLFTLIFFLFKQSKEWFRKFYVDDHTKAYNKNYYLRFKQQQKQAEGYLYVIDIDKFKTINDEYGHDFGDLVLVELVSVIKSNIRSTDLLFRTGGEEFTLFVPGITEERAEALAQVINQRVAQSPVENQTTKINITVSIGYCKKFHHLPFDDVFKRADEALYHVKNNGRNHYHTI